MAVLHTEDLRQRKITKRKCVVEGRRLESEIMELNSKRYGERERFNKMKLIWLKISMTLSVINANNESQSC